MLHNENIICISSIDWDFIRQGHQEIMSIFAKNGNRVLFIENTGVRVPNFKDISRLKKRILNWLKGIKGFRDEDNNLYIYSPVILPFPFFRFARWINEYIFIPSLKRWMTIMKFYDPIIWTFLPTGTALDIINNIDRKLLIYYCIADFYKLVDNPKKVQRTEGELLKKSDLIFVQGEVLKKKCSRLNNNVFIFPFGVNIETFDNFKYDPGNVPLDIRNLKKPIIGYIGGIHRHIDFKLIRFIAQTHPEWSIVLIGPLQTDVSQIHDLANVYLLGKKDFSSLPSYIFEFDVGIIPYLLTDYTKNVYPTKLNEYLAMGKSVISTDLPEIEAFNQRYADIVYTENEAEDFGKCVERAIKEDNEELRKRRIEVARENSWENRIEQMSDLIQKAIQIKMSDREARWKENLLSFYRTTRRRLTRLGTICLSVYFLLFNTPFIWFLAKHLKITDAPQKSDAIVVFAGGVGESGKAGQGYEERVQYAVELYKKGYAKYMVFSSGYMYVFEEPLVMKTLAVYLGVPEDAIILEDKAANTYQNVKFVKEILVEKGWDEIILISSPYNMRRASLVFDKIAPDIKVIYSPIPVSIFYSHGIGPKGEKVLRQINIQQIKGLLHEYLGIIYYWYKGYI